MDAKTISLGLEALSALAGWLPSPIAEIARAALALADEAVKLESGRDPLAQLEELRAVLRAGITASVQEELNKA